MSAASIDACLNWLASSGHCRLLTGGLRGIEKECLRVAPGGRLAGTPHAAEWGSALTHPYITTDYSEALLEFVTPPMGTAQAALQFLDELHAFVLRSAGEQLLWPSSMPCIIESDDAVPIAQYGSSNEGRLRTIYRSGLGYRYGRAMQAIAGMHFNFSLPAEFWTPYREWRGGRQDLQAVRSESLMGLVRNYRRFGWLIVYLCGASPAFSKSFRPAGHRRLEALSDDTWFAPYATSLRMSDMGYRNSTQSRLSVSVNSLADYLRELEVALTTPEPAYEAIGVSHAGEYRQLSANLLQLENEYYSSIRPKPASKSPRLIAALARHGVEYVEVRTLDLNPFVSPGIEPAQLRLLELLLLYCLLADSPPIDAREQQEIDARELAVAWEGRRPGIRVARQGQEVSLHGWALELLDTLGSLAELVDQESGGCRSAVIQAREAVTDPERSLSARVLEAIRGEGGSFFGWAYGLAGAQKRRYLEYRFPDGRLEELSRLAAESLEQTSALEASDDVPFAAYLAEYLGSGIGRTGGRDA